MNSINTISNIVVNLVDFIIKNVSNGDFINRTFYGRLYFALTLANIDLNKYVTVINQLVESEVLGQRSSSNYHWEFNNYAALKLNQLIDNILLKDDLKYIRFKGTKVTNWILLRGLCEVIIGNPKGIQRILNRVKKYQIESGLILDDYSVKSFQYHCFSLAILAEVHILTSNAKIKESFMKGIDFICRFVLPNGMTNYIGRGQEQIFGYGALIFSLEYAFTLSEDIDYIVIQNRVIKHLNGFLNDDGSIPLMLNGVESRTASVENVNVNNTGFLGWYNYNNYFDYLPFFAYYLVYTQSIHKKRPQIYTNQTRFDQSYNDSSFILKKMCDYIAVVSAPGGYWTNDLSFPLIFINERSVTPYYGGEQYGSILFDSFSLPTPWAKYKKIEFGFFRTIKNQLKKIMNRHIDDVYIFRDELKYVLTGDTLIGRSTSFIHKCTYEFGSNFIKVNSSIKVLKAIRLTKFIHLNLFFLSKQVITDSKILTKEFIIHLKHSSSISLHENIVHSSNGVL